MLGSTGEADDAVQETWLRLSRSDASAIENLRGWLTTVVSRVCLNILQARRSRPEVPLEPEAVELVLRPRSRARGAACGRGRIALLIVLDTLAPAERVAFVLHDMFAVPFDDIASIVGRSAPATCQLASSRYAAGAARGRRPGNWDRLRQAKLVDAFLAAARKGDFAALLALLDPDVVLRADETAMALGAPQETRGATDGAGVLPPRARSQGGAPRRSACCCLVAR